MTIRADLEALIARARKARADAEAQYKSAPPDERQAANLKYLALHDVVNDLERTLMHFQRPSSAAVLDGE